MAPKTASIPCYKTSTMILRFLETVRYGFDEVRWSVNCFELRNARPKTLNHAKKKLHNFLTTLGSFIGGETIKNQ